MYLVVFGRIYDNAGYPFSLRTWSSEAAATLGFFRHKSSVHLTFTRRYPANDTNLNCLPPQKPPTSRPSISQSAPRGKVDSARPPYIHPYPSTQARTLQRTHTIQSPSREMPPRPRLSSRDQIRDTKKKIFIIAACSFIHSFDSLARRERERVVVVQGTSELKTTPPPDLCCELCIITCMVKVNTVSSLLGGMLT